ncbi:MAG TPA: hypothetical protein VGJ06_16175 [Candidatus Acidoferrum sp.]|jgi:hypothetical protein
MKRLSLNILLCAVCLLLAASAFSQNNAFVSSAAISFRISSEKKSYGANEEIQLQYHITNTSNAPLYVPRELAATCPTVPHIWAWFEDSSGNHLVPHNASDCVPKRQTTLERMNKEAVLLKPGEQASGPLRLDPKIFHLASGRYRVEASMTGWAAETFSPEERAELEKMGHPFVSGEAPDSLTVILTGELPDHPTDHRL